MGNGVTQNNDRIMENFSLLKTEFFRRLEEGIEEQIKSHYEDMRSIMVKFAHGNLSWRDIHTGLTILISEVEVIIEDEIPAILRKYGKRVLSIAKGLLAQIELITEKDIMPTTKTGTTSEQIEDTVTLTAKYSDVVEIINLIIAMKMLNGGNISNETIINRIHWAFGINRKPGDYYNVRKSLKKRCPEDDETFAYFLSAGLKVLNAELAA